MESLQNETTLVLVGEWNSAILTPEWLLRYGFGQEEGTKSSVRLEFAQVPGFAPRFTIEGVTIQPFTDRLTFHANLNNEERLIRIEQLAKNILNELSHTPILAFGLNFKFREEAPTENLLQLFSVDELISSNDDFDGIGMELIHHIKLSEHCTLNLKLTYRTEAGDVEISFNYDFRVQNAKDAADRIDDSFNDKYKHALSYIDSLGLTLDEPKGEENVEVAINA